MPFLLNKPFCGWQCLYRFNAWLNKRSSIRSFSVRRTKVQNTMTPRTSHNYTVNWCFAKSAQNEAISNCTWQHKPCLVRVSFEKPSVCIASILARSGKWVWGFFQAFCGDLWVLHRLDAISSPLRGPLSVMTCLVIAYKIRWASRCYPNRPNWSTLTGILPHES